MGDQRAQCMTCPPGPAGLLGLRNRRPGLSLSCSTVTWRDAFSRTSCESAASGGHVGATGCFRGDVKAAMWPENTEARTELVDVSENYSPVKLGFVASRFFIR